MFSSDVLFRNILKDFHIRSLSMCDESVCNVFFYSDRVNICSWFIFYLLCNHLITWWALA